jgi:hypothetical protein
MTPDEWISLQKQRLDRLNNSDALFLATTGTMAEMSKRIWGEGKLTDGSKIKYNEDYEVYIYKPPFPQKPNGKGKPYEEWIIRPESVSEKRSQIVKRINSLKRSYDKVIAEIANKERTNSFRLTGNARNRLDERRQRIETAIDVAEEKLKAFRGRFGSKARKIKGQWAPSYLAAKKSQGREDLYFELTGDLRILWAGGVQPTPRVKSKTLCYIDLPEKQSKQAEGLAKQKGNFLELTEGEKLSHRKRLVELLKEELAK